RMPWSTRCATARSPPPRSTSPTRSRFPRITRWSAWTTASSCRISPRPRARRAARWRRWPPRTCSPASAASASRRRSTRRSTARRRLGQRCLLVREGPACPDAGGRLHDHRHGSRLTRRRRGLDLGVRGGPEFGFLRAELHCRRSLEPAPRDLDERPARSRALDRIDAHHLAGLRRALRREEDVAETLDEVAEVHLPIADHERNQEVEEVLRVQDG